jgi:putative sterol carrier protein
MPNERTIISSILTRLSIDVSGVNIRHVRLDKDKRYSEDMVSGFNECLTLDANLDQAASAFRQDLALCLFDKGCAVIVPVDTTINPDVGSFDILSLRVGEVVEWFPKYVRVKLYNENRGRCEEITLAKSSVAIIYNPLYNVMNEQNSTLQRLLRKLGLLDAVDEASASGKLDLIVQLPYTIRSETKRQQAQQRRADIEFQLKGSKYGIAYVDATEKITQLNRPVENNLMAQIEFLTKMLYGQLGLTESVMDGTADDATMSNYWNRTVEPVVTAVVEELKRKFLTKTARTQLQSVMYFTDPFTHIPQDKLHELIDVLSRNQIVTPNEIRQFLGIVPHTDPAADKLVNSNMPLDKQLADNGSNGNQTTPPGAQGAVAKMLARSASPN